MQKIFHSERKNNLQMVTRLLIDDNNRNVLPIALSDT